MISDALCTSPVGAAAWIANRAVLSEYCQRIMTFPSGAVATPLREYPIYFFATLLLEAMILAPALIRYGFSLRRAVLILLAINAASHPIVYFVMPRAFGAIGATFASYLVGSELFAILLESALLRYAWNVSRHFAIFTSIAANLFSWTTGGLWVAAVAQSFR